jgi:ribosomal-protein-alanine N-acetyltransferase
VSVPSLRTERLWLRALTADDADDLHVARGDPEAMRFWYAGTSPSLDFTREETRDIAATGTHWAFGEDDATLGYVGFHGLGRDEGVGFGYCLRRTAWGRGLVVEAARAALAHGFDEVGIRHAELWIDPRNAQSVRVAEKLGASRRGWAPTGRLSLVYGVTREEWRGELVPPATLNVVPVLQVSDVARAMALWTDGLGFRYGWHVGEPAERGQVVAQWTGGPGVRLVRGSMPSIVSMQVTVDVDALAEHAASCGWTLAAPAEDKPWGTRDATLTDPDGNTVSLAGVRP